MAQPQPISFGAVEAVVDGQRVSKDKTEVELRLTGGIALRGFFYVAAGQRVADVLNDERIFIPFMDIGNSVRLLNKAAILEVKPTAQ